MIAHITALYAIVGERFGLIAYTGLEFALDVLHIFKKLAQDTGPVVMARRTTQFVLWLLPLRKQSVTPLPTRTRMLL